MAVPSPRLREGVVLVDTPGVGSLAASGSAETFAYLPRCDLSVVLIDADSNLNDDDLSLLRALYEAGIPAQAFSQSLLSSQMAATGCCGTSGSNSGWDPTWT